MEQRLDALDFRQGDVGFVRGRIPAGTKRIPVKPLAFGEATGHSHRVAAGCEELVEMYEEKNGTIWVRALADVPVQHEEHDPRATISILPAGWEGKITIAREYEEEKSWRPVID
jgi:hypothetical protein